MVDSDYNGFSLYRRLGQVVKPYWPVLLLALVGNMSYAAVDASFVYILKPLLDKVFIAKDAGFIRWMPLLILSLFLVRGVANFISNYHMNWVGRSVVMSFRERIFEHFLRLPARFYDKANSGELLATVVYNAEQVASASTEALATVVGSGCLVLGLFVVMFVNSWQLTVVYLLTIPFIAGLIRLTSGYMRHVSLAIQRTVGTVAHITKETVDGFRVVRGFSGQAYETEKFSQAIRDNRRCESKLIVAKALSTSAVQLIAAIALSLIIYLASAADSALQISTGSFISFVSAMFALLKPMKDLTSINNTIQRGLAGAQSIFMLLDQELEQDTGTRSLTRAQGAIVYDDVSFSYEQGQMATLEHISFRVEPGQMIAVVGKSGSGKTTLVNLLPRFYELQQGHIYLDGIDIRELTLASLREQIAMVSQHVTLFNDTIANNIAYGCLRPASRRRVQEVAEQAHALDFIQGLPQGFDTKVGENGVLLSGGQRQRLAIARALLKDAPVLILDEATSALDSQAEKHIQAAMEQLMQARTTIVIAHRLSTIERADWIVVMDQGRVVEQGTHRELLAQAGHYAVLQQLQFQSQADSHVVS